MLKEYTQQTMSGIWGGIVFAGFGLFLMSMPQRFYVNFGVLIVGGGYALFILGCFMYAKGKGRSWYWGIVGVLGPLGLLFLYCMKDYSKRILARRVKEARL